MADKILSELARGAWSAVTAYTIGDIVTNDGSSYICIADSTNNEPPNASYWALLASKGDQGNQGIQGNPGVDGDDVYMYIAYASDASGANFSNTFDPLLDYIAVKKSLTPIGSPQSSDFVGLWKNYKGATGADGQKGDQGDAGTNGVNTGLKFQFNINTADSDPGDGQVKFNNADPAATTQIFIDNIDRESVDVSLFIDTWDDSTTTSLRGTIILREIGNETNLAIYSVTGAVTDGTGYRKIVVTYVTSGGSFGGGANLSIVFVRSGNKGTDGEGAGDVVGPASATDSAIVLFDSTTGKLIKDSGKAVPTGSIVGTSDSQELANKTLTNPVINVGSDAHGDVYFRNSSGIFTRLAPGEAGTFLKSNGPGADPSYGTPVGGALETLIKPTDVILPDANFPSFQKTIGTNLVYTTLNFDQSTIESCYFQAKIPDSWVSGGTVFFYWIPSGGTGNVVWAIQNLSRADNEALDTALTAADSVTDTRQSDTVVHKASVVLTTTGWAAGEYITFKLFRNASDGGDTLNADAKLLLAIIKWA